MKKKTWIAVLAALAGIGMIGNLTGCTEEKSQEIAVSGDVAYYAAMDNEMRREQCEDKYIEVAGTVTYVGYNLLYIGDLLEDGISIHCQFSEASGAEGVECGDIIKVQGKCTSCYASTMSISECILIETTPATQGTEPPTTNSTSESKTSQITTANTTATTSKTTQSTTISSTTKTTAKEMVWIPTNGGEKYHTHSSCSKMENPKQVTKEEAVRQGFTPCGRCY